MGLRQAFKYGFAIVVVTSLTLVSGVAIGEESPNANRDGHGTATAGEKRPPKKDPTAVVFAEKMTITASPDMKIRLALVEKKEGNRIVVHMTNVAIETTRLCLKIGGSVLDAHIGEDGLIDIRESRPAYEASAQKGFYSKTFSLRTGHPKVFQLGAGGELKGRLDTLAGPDSWRALAAEREKGRISNATQ